MRERKGTIKYKRQRETERDRERQRETDNDTHINCAKTWRHSAYDFIGVLYD